MVGNGVNLVIGLGGLVGVGRTVYLPPYPPTPLKLLFLLTNVNLFGRYWSSYTNPRFNPYNEYCTRLGEARGGKTGNPYPRFKQIDNAHSIALRNVGD